MKRSDAGQAEAEVNSMLQHHVLQLCQAATTMWSSMQHSILKIFVIRMDSATSQYSTVDGIQIACHMALRCPLSHKPG
jgi:hypothetical protein